MEHNTKSPTLPLLDCRPLAVFCAGHAAGAVCIPAAELRARMHELPDPSVPLRLCGDDLSLAAASGFLVGKGYAVLEQIRCDAAWEASLRATGRWETGNPKRRLWQPSPLVQQFVQEYMPRYGIVAGKGMDAACGAGRDAVYLALHGWHMVGIDYRQDALQRVAQLAAAQGVQVQTVLRDLEAGDDPFAEWADGGLDLVCVVRYLHRPLFPYLRRLLKPGGVLLYQTFLVGAERFGSPRNPNYLLQPGELTARCAGAEILLDTVHVLEDGRPLAAFIARFH